MLTIEGLWKSYGDKPVLRGLHAAFEDGKIHGIVGLNGAGKTTLFQCIAGLHDYDGRIAHPRFAVLKNQIGYAAAEPYFFPRITGGEYLEFIRHARGERRVSPDALSFDLPLKEYIHRYSTGMKRKLAITGAAIGRSDIFLLDEPFNGVDIQSNLQLKKLLQQWRGAGKTVLLSSHILSSLTELCDDIFLLRDGTFTRRFHPEEYLMLEEEMMRA